MATTLIALHGFTQNGALMQQAMQPLIDRLPAHVRVVCPTAPNPCSETSVTRMQQLFGGMRSEPPHRCWFDASEDGRQYHGFETSRAQLAALIEDARGRGDKLGLLGFSQGAIGGAALLALSAHGQFPAIDFSVLIAGRVPRADAIAPLLSAPLKVPSLHVWGERDLIAKPYVQALIERFDESTRSAVEWPGSHTVPGRGVGADAIVRFVEQHADNG